MDRRKFLKLGGVAGGLSMLGPLTSKMAYALNSQIAPDHFFVQISMNGGWDTSLGLDPWISNEVPKEEDMYIEYLDEMGKIDQNQLYSFDKLTVGPSMKSMVPYLKDMLVLNGIFMSTRDNGHGAPFEYIMSGSPTGGNADLSVEINQAKLDAPFGIATNTHVNIKTTPQIVTPVSEFEYFLNVEDPTLKLKNWTKKVSGSSELISAIQSLISGSSQSQKLKLMLKNHLVNNEELSVGQVLSCAFNSGVCATAQLDFSSDVFGSLDTHSGHPENHNSYQSQHWQKIAELIETFKSTPFGNSDRSLYEHTTFYICSEFCRTPALNSANGKDHNPYNNSVCILGRGVRGGQSIGKSKLITRESSKIGMPYTVAMPFDFKNNVAVDEYKGTGIIFPENVVRTVAQIMNVNWDHFKAVPKDINWIESAVL